MTDRLVTVVGGPRDGAIVRVHDRQHWLRLPDPFEIPIEVVAEGQPRRIEMTVGDTVKVKSNPEWQPPPIIKVAATLYEIRCDQGYWFALHPEAVKNLGPGS